ncbi:MAG: HU family DNA-binding protein [Dissulfurispiraceae bacterium]|jgi:hypothetical protein
MQCFVRRSIEIAVERAENPQTGVAIKIASRKVPKFSAGKTPIRRCSMTPLKFPAWASIIHSGPGVHPAKTNIY